jgi:hypothetical protein
VYRIRKILQEALTGKELISSETYAIITNAIAEYGHMMSGERYSLGDLAQKIGQNLSQTETIIEDC